jgi:hypothetical protein
LSECFYVLNERGEGNEGQRTNGGRMEERKERKKERMKQSKYNPLAIMIT